MFSCVLVAPIVFYDFMFVLHKQTSSSLLRIFLTPPQLIIAFDKGERLLIRLFASPMCLRCHLISEFGRHLGVEDKCFNIMLPSVGGVVTSPRSAELAQLSCFPQPIELLSGLRNCDTYTRLGH